MSWTPHEFQLLKKGAHHKQIDDYEKKAVQALLNAKAKSKKRIKLKDLFDADKARRKLETGNSVNQDEIERIKRMNRAVKGFKPNFIPKKKVNR